MNGGEGSREIRFFEVHAGDLPLREDPWATPEIRNTVLQTLIDHSDTGNLASRQRSSREDLRSRREESPEVIEGGASRRGSVRERRGQASGRAGFGEPLAGANAAPEANERDVLAGRQGLEPRFTGPEPVVLPLNDLPVVRKNAGLYREITAANPAPGASSDQRIPGNRTSVHSGRT